MKERIKGEASHYLPFLLLAACATLFFSELGSHALWVPFESRYAELAREMAQRKMWLLPHPPLVHWFTATAMSLFGPTAFAARFWNAVFALATVGLVYLIGKRWKSERAGLLSGSILATSFLFFGLSQKLALDMTLTGWMTLALWAAIHLLTERIPEKVAHWSYIFAFACAMGVLSKGVAGILLPVLVLFGVASALSLGYQLRKISWKPAAGIVFAISAAWLIPAALQHPLAWQSLMGSPEPRGPYFICVPVLLAGFLPWAVFLPQTLRKWWERRGAGLKRDPIAALLVAWIIVITLYFSLIGERSVSCILPVFPALALLTGNAFEEALSGEAMPGWVQGGIVSLVVLFSMGLLIIKVPLPFAFFRAPPVAAFLHAAGLLGILLGLGVFVLVGVWGMRDTWAAFGGLLVVQVLLLTSINSAALALDPYFSARDLGHREVLERSEPNGAYALIESEESLRLLQKSK